MNRSKIKSAKKQQHVGEEGEESYVAATKGSRKAQKRE